MRRDFCSFLLTVCPCLQEYGNISFLPYSKHTPHPSPGHELNRSQGEAGVVIANDGTSSSNSGVTLEESVGEKSAYGMARALIMTQPSKKHISSSHLHHHVTIESPD